MTKKIKIQCFMFHKKNFNIRSAKSWLKNKKYKFPKNLKCKNIDKTIIIQFRDKYRFKKTRKYKVVNNIKVVKGYLK